jgi:hypothetical protein
MSFSKILAKTITNYGKNNSVGSRFRAKRIQPLMNMIEVVFKKYGFVDIVDIGGTDTYWNIVPEHYLDDYNVTVTVVNLPGVNPPEDFGRFKFIDADACNLEIFPKNKFHIAHSNSVVEHVGDWERMLQFANEISRIAEFYFVQTPNFWFPLEPHCMTPFFHWLPKPIRVWMVLHFQLGHWEKANSISEAVRSVEGARLIDKNMFQELFNDGSILTERLFLLPKSFIAIRK